MRIMEGGFGRLFYLVFISNRFLANCCGLFRKSVRIPSRKIDTNVFSCGGLGNRRRTCSSVINCARNASQIASGLGHCSSSSWRRTCAQIMGSGPSLVVVRSIAGFMILD